MGEERSALFYFTPVHWSIDIFHERIADIVPRIIYTINRFEKERNEIQEFTMARSNNLQIVVVVVWGGVVGRPCYFGRFSHLVFQKMPFWSQYGG